MPKEIDLANLILEELKEGSELRDYISVSEKGIEPKKIPLANLMYHMEEYYDRATTVKTFLDFLIDDIGIRKTRCIFMVAIDDMDLYRIVASVVNHSTEGFLVARAHSLTEVERLVPFFNVNKLLCGVIIAEKLGGLPCEGIISSLGSSLPIMVIGKNLRTGDYIRFLGLGANSIVESHIPIDVLRRNIETALYDMFLGG